MHKRYRKKYDYSYCLGAYPTIKLLEKKPQQLMEVIVHSQYTPADGVPTTGEDKIRQLSKIHNIPVRYNDKIIEKLSPKENCYVIGLFHKYSSRIDNDNHLVLVNPSNTGNLGTILRTMSSFSVKNLVLIEPAVDIFNPETIRSSMGSLFSINFSLFANIETYFRNFPEHHCYLLMTNGINLLQETKFKKPFSIVFGNEAKGLPQSFQKYGSSVRIEQSDETDSLNLAIAVGIVLYQSVR